MSASMNPRVTSTGPLNLSEDYAIGQAVFLVLGRKQKRYKTKITALMLLTFEGHLFHPGLNLSMLRQYSVHVHYIWVWSLL